MGQFNPADYEEVKDRLPRFWGTVTPPKKPHLETILHTPPERLTDEACFEARLFDGDSLLSVGWAFEKAGQGMVNKTSHVENCETSAIGRALANMTLHGDKRPSREEMSKASPPPQQKTGTGDDDSARSGAGGSAGSNGFIAEVAQKQLKTIAGGDVELIARAIQTVYGEDAPPLERVEKTKYSAVVDELKALV